MPPHRPTPPVHNEAEALPGLFDFQINGFGGVDFQMDDLDEKDLLRATRSLRRHGVAGLFVAFITDTIDRLCRRLECMEKLRTKNADIGAILLGYHLEGPWLSPAPGYCGAHPPAKMRAPSAAEFQLLQSAAGGGVRLITLAPEWPGAIDFIALLAAAGVHVSLGHTQAGEADIDAAISAGARFCTHLGNGVPGLLPRHDNVVQRLLARDELTACFIPDGVHLPPFTLQNFFRAKPPGRVLFTTDAMAGAGAPPGCYTLGDVSVRIGTDGVARAPGDSGLAGSTLTPDEGVRRVCRYLRLPQDEARRLWSIEPARMFGVELGSNTAP